MNVMDKIMKAKGFQIFITSLIGIIFGFVVASIIIALIGVSPLKAYRELFMGAFGSAQNFSFTLMRFIPLAFTGLAVTFAFRGGMFNIGAEGQLYVSALAATWIAVSITGLPSVLHITLAVLSGAAAAAIFAFIPGYLKATRNFNEILVTILLNYIGINLVGLALNTFLMAPNQRIPWSARIAESAIIPKVMAGSPLHIGVFLVFILAIIVYYIFWHTTWGYEIRTVGANSDAASYGGINVKRVMILTMVLSGVLASFAGSLEILGAQHRLQAGFLVNYGYYGIPVALLGGLNPFGTLLAAFFFGALFNGAVAMQAATGIPVAIVGMVQALAIFGVIGITGVRQVYVSSKAFRRREISHD